MTTQGYGAYVPLEETKPKFSDAQLLELATTFTQTRFDTGRYIIDENRNVIDTEKGKR